MEILNKKQKIILVIIVSAILIFIGYCIVKKASNNNYEELEIEENEINENIIEEESKIIMVHIVRKKKKQGIVEIEEGARIADVIKKAGGETEEADLSKINLAYPVEDGEKIYIPNKNDKENLEYITEGIGNEKVYNNEESKININKASQVELETLPGIGPSTALKIIEYREENGKFEQIEDIKNVSGIGDAKFENIKESICVK